MKKKKSSGRNRAVLVHDGTAWRLHVKGRGEVAAMPSPANKLPDEIVERAVAEGVGEIRFLVSGVLHRMDGVVLDSLGLAKARETMLTAIAEETGVETDGMLCAGFSTTWTGVRKPFSLAAKFDGDVVEEFHAVLADAGISCGGFASLEMAMLAAWRGAAKPKESFVAISQAHALVAPAPRGANPGPQTAACGLRHFATDSENWLTRFQRSSASIARANPLRLLVLSGEGAKIAGLLENDGYAAVECDEAGVWLDAAVRLAFAAKANCLKCAGVPLANPYEPRRKFADGWIVLAAAVVLALPFAFRSCWEISTKAQVEAINAESAKYVPLEKRVEKAKKALDAAKRELARERADGQARVAARRPLMAFVEIAHFFCQNAGGTVVLEAIEEHNCVVSVKGTYSDPEDGVKLNKHLLAMAKDNGLEIVKNESVHDGGGDGANFNRFSIVIDCRKFGGDVK